MTKSAGEKIDSFASGRELQEGSQLSRRVLRLISQKM